MTASSSGSPTLPAATVRSPAAASTRSSILTVVVLPFVPVRASHSGAPGRRSRQASSTSPTTSTPAAAAATSSGLSGRQPGLVTTSAVPSGGALSASTRRPSARSGSARSSLPSATTTDAPRSRRARAAAVPLTPAPATTTGRPCQSVIRPAVPC